MPYACGTNRAWEQRMKVVTNLLAKLPDELARQIPDVKLQEQDIKVPVAQGDLTRENILLPKVGLADFSLSFEAGGEASIRNFNSPGDVDESGVVGEASAQEVVDALRPQLLLGGDTGWMRYQLTARLKAAASASLSFLSGNVQGEVSVSLSDYRAHPLTRNMREAARADLKEPRLVARQEDLLKLGTGDAVAWQVRGQLQTGVELNWADLFTANLGSLAFARGGELLGLKTSLKASLTARVSLTDDYQLSFSRPRPGRIQVAVRKVKSHEAALGAGLGVTVDFLDPAAVRSQAGAVLDALLGPAVRALAGQVGTKKDGTALEVMDALVEKASALKLEEPYKKVLRAALERLGLDGQLAELANLKAAWEDFKKKVETALDKVAKAQISSGFQYEYLRLAQSSTLLDVVVDDARALEFHASLIRGNLVKLLEWLKQPANAKAFELKSYLHATTLTRQQAYGFSLGMGAFEVLKAAGVRKQSWVTQENHQGARRMAFLGRRGYEDKLLGNRSQWVVDFKADMERFSPAPVASDFRYGLHLMLLGRQKKLSRKELLQAVDDATVWGVLDADDAASVVSALEEHLGKAPLETQLELKVHDDTFRALVPRLQAFDSALFSRALARAMPWSDERARATVEARGTVYGPMWHAYLDEVRKKGGLNPGDLSPTRAAQIAEWFLKQDPRVKELGRDLLLVESQWRPPGGAFTFAEVTEKNRDTFAKCRGFVDGMVRLRRALDERKAADELRAVFSELEGLWSTGFHLRAAGALLAELAQATPLGLAGVERTFTVRLPEQEQQLVFSTVRGLGSP